VVVVTRQALAIIRELERAEQQQLAGWLSSELSAEPTVDTVVISQGVPHSLPPGRYLAHAVLGYVAVYRPLTQAELERYAVEKGLKRGRRPTSGFIVFDLFPAVAS